jgi:DUF4097 and DUF4098 domain-containing protein YvlB
MKQNGSTYFSREESFEIENPEVFVETVSSEITIAESPDGKCHVEIFADSENAKHLTELVEIIAKDRKLSVSVDKRNKGLRGFFSAGPTELSVTIKLPKTSTVKLRTVSAEIEINSVLLGLDVGSVSGNITILQNPAGACILKTVSGDIASHTFSACQYSLKSVSGDISIHVAPGLEVDVDGRSISGDLESEISLSSNNEATAAGSETVSISTSTVSGDFILARS